MPIDFGKKCRCLFVPILQNCDKCSHFCQQKALFRTEKEMPSFLLNYLNLFSISRETNQSHRADQTNFLRKKRSCRRKNANRHCRKSGILIQEIGTPEKIQQTGARKSGACRRNFPTSTRRKIRPRGKREKSAEELPNHRGVFPDFTMVFFLLHHGVFPKKP